MNYQLGFGLVLGAVWGALVALFIRLVPFGRFLVVHLTWLVVACGVGVDALILLLLTDEEGRLLWWHMVAVFAVSSVPLALASLLDLSSYFQRIIDGLKDSHRE